MNRRPFAAFAVLALVCVTQSAARAEVLFENPGNKMGWGRVFTQKAGTITEVSSPVYRGTTSVKTTQTYQSSDGANYHSEIIKTQAQLAGQDLYYGHAVYLPADWVFHGQNVTFQQWAPEDPEGPWILMYLQGDRVRLGGRGANGDKDVGTVAGLRGTWIRFVTRIHMASGGAFEVWINGQKVYTCPNCDFRSRGPSLRWSNGIYCTRWDTETPTGPRELTFWHDNMRITTTLAEADPASWGGDAAPADASAEPPADAGASSPPDARPPPMVDAGAPAMVDAGPAPMAGRGGSAGGGTGGSGGEVPEDPPRSAPAATGCQVSGGGGGSGLILLGALLLLSGRARLRCIAR
jgi:hypothetical protein